MKRLSLTTCALLGAALSAFAGPYDAWTKSRLIKVNTTTAGVTTAQTNFPLLVRLTNTADSTGANVLSQALANGADLRFASADGSTALSYEIERWTASAAEIWVKVPSIAGSAVTSIRMYWGATGQTSASNGALVFDTAGGYVSNWHLGNAAGLADRPNAVAGAPVAVMRSYLAGYVPVPGIIGMADTVFGDAGDSTAATARYIDMRNANYAGFRDFTKGFSFATWVRPTSLTNQFVRGLEMLEDSTKAIANVSPTRVVIFFNHSSAANGVSVRWGSQTAFNSTANQVAAGVWKHVVVSHPGGAAVATLYVDGVQAGQTASFTDLAVVDRPHVRLGRSFSTDAYFNGKYDEVSISKVGRSADWAKLSYETQKAAVTAVALDTTLTGTVVVTIPGAPSGVTGVAGASQVTVTWVAPTTGSSPTGYTAVAVSDASKTCTTTGALTCTITGLTAGTGYTFTVKASNSAGTSGSSAASGTVTPYTVPGAPTGVTGVGGTAGQITVNWVAPASNGGSAVTGYRAMVVGDSTAKFCTTTGALTCVITGLVNTTAYTFQVRAINLAGSGALSTASAAVTGLRPGAFAVRVNGSMRPYAFSITPSEMAATEAMTMKVSNLQGRTVWSKTVNPASDKVSEISWNGASSNGSQVSPGVYLVRVSLLQGGKTVDFMQKSVDVTPAR